MVTARIAGLSPGTSPPPVRIPITPFLVLMRPPYCFPGKRQTQCFDHAKRKLTKRLDVQDMAANLCPLTSCTAYSTLTFFATQTLSLCLHQSSGRRQPERMLRVQELGRSVS